jgi:uncharacterized protein YdiU (UPF0061 family)
MSTHARSVSTTVRASSSGAPATDKDSKASTTPSILRDVQAALENSWVRQLSPETAENLKKSRKAEGLPDTDDNRTRRPVFNGHYVPVKPTGIAKPRLVMYSPDMASQLQLTPEQVASPDFVDWVSGNTVLGETWATPYALSIMGTRYTNNCPYGTGNGYGDGRAISIGELHGLELQLKGGGTTPFHRGADGRAVLRSSIREFLASEAMHSLNVSTTRALSLVVSELDTISRPWYSDNSVLRIPDMDDPRLAQYDTEERKRIIQQLKAQSKADPNIMVREKTAITCRVATSFLRVGHLDLFARRVERTSKNTDGTYDTSTLEWKELEDLVWHACYREYRHAAYEPFHETRDIAAAAHVLLKQAADRIAAMVAGWVRVGFIQGNFNADNCLVGGRTMDYGPFGFLEYYHPTAAKWTGSGEHFGFLNQPSAGFANFKVLAESVVPVIAAAHGEPSSKILKNVLDDAAKVFQNKVDETFRKKLGFTVEQDIGDDVWEALEPLLRLSQIDWTLFFRQLTMLLKDFPDLSSEDYAGMLCALEGSDTDREGSSPFYEPLTQQLRARWLTWIEQWRVALDACGSDTDIIFEQMRTTNPKFVLREWMLVDAYTRAAAGDESDMKKLFELIQRPYDEGTEDEKNRFYRRASEEALTTGGTAFMS